MNNSELVLSSRPIRVALGPALKDDVIVLLVQDRRLGGSPFERRQVEVLGLGDIISRGLRGKRRVEVTLNLTNMKQPLLPTSAAWFAASCAALMAACFCLFFWT